MCKYALYVCMCMCVSESFQCQVSAVPICSSHGASWTCSAINQSPAMAECLQTHTHRHRSSHTSSHKPLTTLSSEKTEATRYFIKRLQLLCTWARSKKDSLSQDSTQTTGRAASSFSQFCCLSYSADSNLEDINSQFHEFTGHKFYICVMLETVFPLVTALKI